MIFINFLEKEIIHRELWSGIYTADDEIAYEETENTVMEFLNTHHITYPFEHSDPGRLHMNNYLTQPITDEDIINAIKYMKKNLPRKQQNK